MKLSWIFDYFPDLMIEDLICADLGCNVGGFTREMVYRGAGQVISIDTGYGTLAWELRQHPKVVVRERTNALHLTDLRNIDFIACDLGWTPMAQVVPKVLEYLSPGRTACCLLKPQYEEPQKDKRGQVEILSEEKATEVAERTFQNLNFSERNAAELVRSPLKGGKGSTEFWLVFKA